MVRGPVIDRRLVRRAGPAVYAVAIVIAVLFARDALVAVVIVGAVLLGLMYTLLRGSPDGPARPGRNRDRGR
jgi:hypothetical protein